MITVSNAIVTQGNTRILDSVLVRGKEEMRA